MPNSTFTEKEVAEILRRAANMQAQQGTGDHGHGLTLEDLAHIAAESGLDPALVAQAAADVKRGVRSGPTPIKVSSRQIVAERWLPHHISDLAVEDMIAHLRHEFELGSSTDWSHWGMGSSGKGRVETIGRSTEWQYVNPWYGTQTRVLVQPREQGTRIRVTRNNIYSGTATGWHPFYVLLAGALAAVPIGLILGLNTAAWIGFLAALLTLAAAIPLALQLSSRALASAEREIKDLVEELVVLATPATAVPSGDATASPIVAPAGPQISLEDGPEEVEKQPTSLRRRVSN